MERFHKTTKYKINVMVILVFLLQILLSLGSNIVWAEEVDVIDNIEITNEQGESQDSYRPYDRIRIYVDWSIKSDIKSGDTFSFELPKELRGFDGTIQLKDAAGVNFGTGVGLGDLIKFTFFDAVEEYDNISGYFYIESEIQYMEQQGEIQVPLIFKVKGKIIDAIEVPINVDTGTNVDQYPGNVNTDELFEKQGRIDEYDDTLINWILRINYNGEILTDTILTDVLGEGHEFVDGSLSVYEGYTNYGTGEIENLTNVSLGNLVEYDFSSNSLKLRFDIRGDGNHYHYDDYGNWHYQGQSYMVYYQTRITDNTKADFTNEATLRAWNKDPITRVVQVQSFNCGGGALGDLKKYKGQLKIIKIDEETKEPLSGAIFELINDEEQVVAELKTDENGEVCTEEIPGGFYILKEIKAPEGYEIEEEPQEITLDFKENREIECIITNKMIVQEEPEDPVVEPEEPEQPVDEEPVEEPEDEPTVEPEEPVEDPAIEPEEPEDPVVEPEEPEQPVDEEPVEEPEDEPTVEPEEPVEDPAIEPEEPEDPVVEPEEPEQPVDEEPVEEPEDEPTVEPEEPVEDPAIEPEEPEDPVVELEEPKQPVDEEPVEEPEDEPTVEPQEPIIEIEDDEIPLGEVEDEPTDPEDTVVEPADEEPIVEPDEEPTIEIEDDDIPLGEIDVEPEDEPTIELKNVDAPINAFPKTGESSKQIFYFSGLLSILMGIILRRRK